MVWVVTVTVLNYCLNLCAVKPLIKLKRTVFRFNSCCFFS